MSKRNENDSSIGLDKHMVKRIKQIEKGFEQVGKEFRQIAAANPFVQLGQDANTAHKEIHRFNLTMVTLQKTLSATKDQFSDAFFIQISEGADTARKDIQGLADEVSLLSEKLKLTKDQFSGMSFSMDVTHNMVDIETVRSIFQQDFAEWESKNKDPLGDFAPYAQGISTVADVISIIEGLRGLTKGGKTVKNMQGIARTLRLASVALRLIVSPAGLIAAAAIGVGAGGYAIYQHQKKKKEQDRQETIHSGTAVGEAYEGFDETKKQTQHTFQLLDEYYNILQILSRGPGTTEEMDAIQLRMRELVQQLHELHPETLTQYDIENGAAHLKIGILRDKAIVDEESAKLELDQAIARQQSLLPKLIAEMSQIDTAIPKLQSELDVLDKRKLELDKARPVLQGFMNEYSRLMAMDESPERDKSVSDLWNRVQQFQASIGEDLGINVLTHIETALPELNRRSEEILGLQQLKQAEIQQKKSERNTANASYEAIYYSGIRQIEEKLGGEIPYFIENYNNLSEEQRIQTMQAVEAVRLLNDEMKLMPPEKRIRVDLEYNKKAAEHIVESMRLSGVTHIPVELQKYVDGGYADKPVIPNPYVEKEPNPLLENWEGYQKQQNSLDDALLVFRGFESEMKAIDEIQDGAARMQARNDVLTRAWQYISESGLDMGYLQENSISGALELMGTDRQFYAQLEKLSREKLKGQVSPTYLALYNSGFQEIEMELGGKLADHIKNYNTLSDEMKKKTMDAVEALKLLNAAMPLMPDDKVIRLDVEFGKMQAVEAMRKSGMVHIPASMQSYGSGGFSNSPAIFGEAGLEAAIPINNKPRSHQLLNRVNALMGHDTGGVIVHANFAPNVTIQGGGPNVASQVRQGIMMAQDEFERMLRTAIKHERRVGYG